jgi:hypothetical protein
MQHSDKIADCKRKVKPWLRIPNQSPYLDQLGLELPLNAIYKGVFQEPLPTNIGARAIMATKGTVFKDEQRIETLCVSA